jgi:hypothetical protein
MQSNDKTFFLTENKKNRVLRNKNGKEIKVDINNFNSSQVV